MQNAPAEVHERIPVDRGMGSGNLGLRIWGNSRCRVTLYLQPRAELAKYASTTSGWQNHCRQWGHRVTSSFTVDVVPRYRSWNDDRLRAKGLLMAKENIQPETASTTTLAMVELIFPGGDNKWVENVA